MHIRCSCFFFVFFFVSPFLFISTSLGSPVTQRASLAIPKTYSGGSTLFLIFFPPFFFWLFPDLDWECVDFGTSCIILSGCSSQDHFAVCFFCWCFLFLKRWNNFLCNYLIFRMLLLVIILLYYSKCQLIEIQSYHFTSGFNSVTVCTGPAWHLIISSYHLGLYFSMFFSEKGHSAQVSVWLKGGIHYINLSVTICAHIIYMKHEHDYSHKI